MDMIQLSALLVDKEAAVHWFINHRLLKSRHFCNICNREMILTKKSNHLNGLIWRCRSRRLNGHDVEVGLYVGSSFSESKIEVRLILILMYEWSTETSVKAAIKKSGLCNKTVIGFFKQIRLRVSRFLSLQSPLNFGGVGNKVQLDESKFMKLKHNRGYQTGIVRRKYWAFGMYDVDTKRVFLKVVRNRRRETLFPLILGCILPYTTIWSDEFSVYTGGPNYPSHLFSPLALIGPYNHQVVKHKTHFKDPRTGVHTNAIEGCWSGAKKKFKMMNGTRRHHMQSYIDEFVWRKNHCKDSDAFECLVQLLRLDND